MATPEQTTQTQTSQPSDALLASQTEGASLDSQYDDDRTAGLEADQAEVNRGREQGLGMGERELNAQGDVGNVVAADEDDGADVDEDEEDDVEPLDGDVAVQGDDEEEEDGAGV